MDVNCTENSYRTPLSNALKKHIETHWKHVLKTLREVLVIVDIQPYRYTYLVKFFPIVLSVLEIGFQCVLDLEDTCATPFSQFKCVFFVFYTWLRSSCYVDVVVELGKLYNPIVAFEPNIWSTRKGFLYEHIFATECYRILYVINILCCVVLCWLFRVYITSQRRFSVHNE